MKRKPYRECIDKNIQTFFDAKIGTYKELGVPERVLQMISYLKINAATGKRIRPYLVYLGYKIFAGKDDKEIERFSLAFEVFHAFALIHDDLMDKGEMRHGEMTCHRYIEFLLDSPEREHIAYSEAILLGDLLAQWANEIIYDEYTFELKYLQLARKNFQDMTNETILGQMMDIDFMARDILATQKNILLKDTLKTAMYSFVRPMMTGALLAGKTQKELEKFKQLGLHLGTAFQWRDDLRDIILTEKESDKTVFSDITEGDQTIFTHYILEQGSEEDKKLLHSLWGKVLTIGDKQKLKTMFEVSGAIAYGRDYIEQQIKNAKKILDTDTEMLTEYKQGLYELIQLIENH